MELNRITLLLVDDNATFRRQLAELLEMQPDFALLGEARTGLEALELSESLQPDLLILDDMLPILDGLGVLGRLGQVRKPRIIALLSCAAERLAQLYYTEGADLCLLRPVSPEVVVDRARLLMGLREWRPEPGPPRPPTVADLLKRTGIPMHLDGYHYLKDAVQYVLERGGQTSGMTKDVYPAVARMWSTIPARVERSMRHAIEVAWNRADLMELNRLFGATIHHRRGKPTNGEFVALLADHLRNQQSVS